MKNRIYIIAIVILFILIITITIKFFVFGFNKVDKSILNKEWYHYNYKSGIYDTLLIKNGYISFKNSNLNDNFSDCKKYNYNKKNYIIELDCNKKILINKIDNSYIQLIYNNLEYNFYDNFNNSLNFEFEKYYGKTKIEFIKEKEQVSEYSKINNKRLFDIIKSNIESKVVFYGDKCTSIDCALALDVMEKWITKNPNVYYFNSNNIDNTILNRFKELNITYDKDYFNNIYPIVLIFKNNSLIDSYEMKCEGFNCNNLIKK